MVIGFYERGINTGTLTVFKQNVAADGTLSDDGAFGNQSLYGSITSVEQSSENRTRELSPMTRRQMNNVATKTGSNYTFSGLIIPTGTPARKVAFGADYVRMVWAHGLLTEQFYGLIGRFQQRVSEEEGTYTMTILHVDDLTVGGTVVNNPSLAGTV